MKREFVLFIQDILEYIETAERFVAGMSYEDFAKDEKTKLAVVRCVEIIGEAAKHVPSHIRKKYSTVPWKDMAGMRDIIAHFYFGIVMERVWKVAKVMLPPLKPHIQKVLDDIASGETPHAAKK